MFIVIIISSQALINKTIWWMCLNTELILNCVWFTNIFFLMPFITLRQFSFFFYVTSDRDDSIHLYRPMPDCSKQMIRKFKSSSIQKIWHWRMNFQVFIMCMLYPIQFGQFILTKNNKIFSLTNENWLHCILGCHICLCIHVRILIVSCLHKTVPIWLLLFVSFISCTRLWNKRWWRRHQ